jgi:membrane fusion protein (multidrug efflux system)
LLDKIRHDISRYHQALPSGSVSAQVLQNAEDQKASLEAELKEARAEFQSAEAQVGGTTRTNHPEIKVARNKFLDAYIEFFRQQIRAPVSGYIAKRKAQVGDRVRPGDQVVTIVPLDHLWVEANLWESSLRGVRPGQPARVTVDLSARSKGLCPAPAASLLYCLRTMRQEISFILSNACPCGLPCERTRF